MANQLAKNKEIVRRRADSFLSRPEYAGVRAILAEISAVAPTAIFGGFPRDLARYGVDGFNSDLDLVVDCQSITSILDRLGPVHFTNTGMGGIRICGHRLQIDLWTLQDTWAIKNGIVEANHLADLIHTTFFDCDAIIYQLDTREIVCSERYFSSLSSDVIDISVEINPNPLSMTIRTLRFLKRRRLKISARLAGYLLRRLEELGNESICAAEYRKYDDHCLDPLWVKAVESDLRLHRTKFPLRPYGVYNNRRALTDLGSQRLSDFQRHTETVV
ncbi:MAG: hypothetical protein JNM83_05310 [Myxococcales bacterium]|nr:hypothetical protein [Myxococcales bacterium]